MSGTIPNPAELKAALAELQDRKPHRFAAYVCKHGIPVAAGERTAVALLESLTPARKVGPAAKRLAQARLYYERQRSIDGDGKAHANACALFGIKDPRILDNALRGCRQDVNRALEEWKTKF